MFFGNIVLDIFALGAGAAVLVGCAICRSAPDNDNNHSPQESRQQPATRQSTERIACEGSNGLVAASVVKPSPDFKVGIGIAHDKRQRKIINSLTGLFAQTNLKRGMLVLQINGVHVERLPLKEVAGIISNAQHSVTVLAKEPPDSERYLAVAVVKPTPTAKVGLSLARCRDGNVKVSRLNGLFAETDLQVGMKILQVNGVDVDGMELKDVLNLISWAQGTVTVLAKRLSDPIAVAVQDEPEFNVASLNKAEEEEFTSRTMDMSLVDPELGEIPKISAANGSSEGLAAELEGNQSSQRSLDV
ncbi:expressed unknown protein [Seminavis robusta]|uniref:PDZ domain-containing protein n=1 Tax=Seminavis robusta TaxID=568900 RepID=A0A9N8EJK5_9STRA|nr:expressed unknown protein [Seminavis robusta]|eukprot:Sro1103_g241710.1 n/a (302) ;mRNA; r:26613-27518